jgi:hypothetical protein
MPNKIIRIDGLPEAVAFLNNHPNQLKSTMKKELSAIGDAGVNTMKGNAHRVTGRMVNSISKKAEGDMKVSINVSVGYAGYENRRGNPHDFFDRSIQGIEKNATSRITSAITKLVSSGGR